MFVVYGTVAYICTEMLRQTGRVCCFLGHAMWCAFSEYFRKWWIVRRSRNSYL